VIEPRAPAPKLLAWALAAQAMLHAQVRAEEPLSARAVARDERAPSVDASVSSVSRAQMQERLSRSAPDALRYEPGVSVQQTAHGQASPYVRGMTGQQVLHAFDGIRMNNGLYRQGPNQYFFTVDSYTLERIDVVRGSASTRYGSDALGGAVLATPREPLMLDEPLLHLHPRAYGRLATADLERGGRVELDAQLARGTALLLGVGHREAERLESGGALDTGGRPAPRVPAFEGDGRTQLGTGFTESTFDARVAHAVTRTLRAIGAVYGYRQYDAPRTDLCPPPEAPRSECLRIDEQLRTLGYIALRGDAGPLREVDLSLSVQQHDERRVNDRPRSFIENVFEDGVTTLGAVARAATPAIAIGDDAHAHYRVHFGGEAYRDAVSSRAEQRLTDPALQTLLPPDRLVRERSRGQYMDGAFFLQTGLFAELELVPIAWLTLRGGGRLAATMASASADEASSTTAVHRRWTAAVGRAGASAEVAPQTHVHLGFDQGFRTPNLDDLTSRQQVGPGFQLENAQLAAERTNTLELGVTTDVAWLTLQAFVFGTWLEDGITRAFVETDACPPETDGCNASRTRLQLVNARGTAFLWGTEGVASATLTDGLTLRVSCGFAFGEGPDPREGHAAERVPLSRVPPPNGTAELRYRHRPSGVYVALASRFALSQQRLAPSDYSDPRIPIGGTPGYAVQDLRAGYRYAPHLSFSVVLENVLDAAYRVHGSSIHGPGRGLLLGVMLGY
jgi:iron complex outermembrane receptor protein/hemoglobin/transferrin/lactoferrin receptor protein